MRCSGWSSLAISASSAVALVLVAPAHAHISLTPKAASAGEAVELVFSVPNESEPSGVVRVTIGAPPEMALDDAETKPGWTQTRSGQAVTWSGGRIPKGQFATFGLRGTAPDTPGEVLFNVLVGAQSGETATTRVALEVDPPSAQAHDSGARTLGKAALIVAIVAGALALAAGFVALYVWLRPSAG